MRHLVVIALCPLTLIAASAVPVSAQSRERAVVSINGAFQTTRNPFTDRFEFEVNRETASTETHYPAETGVVIDGSLVVRLWKRLGAGVAVSQFTRDDRVTTESQIPHPFFFDRDREVTGEVDVTRTERGVHGLITYRVPIARPITLMLFAGPSFITLEQDVVTSVEYDEAFPYDTATFRRAQTRKASASAVGFNAGVDLTWMFSRHVGVGGLARLARATIDLEVAAGRSRSVEAGGFVGGGGLRIVF